MRKMMKPVTVFFLVTMLLLGIVGCGSNSTAQRSTDQGSTAQVSTAQASTDQKDTGKAITMRMSWWGGESRHKATLKAIEQYQAKNPNIKIQGEYGGWDGYLEKLTTQLAAGTAPDIMQTDYQFLDQFSKQESLFVDLATNKNMDLKGFDADFLNGLKTPSGKLIGAPTGINASAFFLNKNLADKVGIDYSKQLTWDRLLEEGKKLHSAHSDMYLLNMTIDLDLKDYIFEPYLFNITGNRLVNDDYTIGFDRDSLIKTFKYINSLYDNGVMQPVAETANIKSGTKFQNPKWLNNQIVGILSVNSFYVTIKKSLPNNEIIVVDFPATKGVKNSGILLRPTNMLSVNANSKSVDEAVKFVSWFFNDTEAVKTLGLERSIPAVESARQTLLNDGVIDKQFDYSVKYATENQGLPQSFVSLNAEIQKIENDILAKLAFKEWTPEKASDEMLKQIPAKLSELKGKSK